MKSKGARGLFQRVYFEAVGMGLLIGIAALLINRWAGEAGWLWRSVALAVVGGLLCLVQYGLGRARRG